ncbi:MAG: hypothetical protein PHY93_11095 [Bacteriovorax sp.]|nr:hypothetical protein [Bacteriovorax sp.]
MKDTSIIRYIFLAGLIGLAGCTTSTSSHSLAKTTQNEVIEATINVDSHLREIPSYFLGFSFEKDQLETDQFTIKNKVLEHLLKNLGTGTLRFGANTVDLMKFTGGPTLPSSCKITSTVNPAAVKAMFQFAKKVDWKVIYGLNLGCNVPLAGAYEAKFVQAASKEELLAFEIGNEPDLFVLQGLRTNPWNVSSYIDQYNVYQKTIQKEVAGAHLSGPGLGNFITSLEWLPPFMTAESKNLTFASVHFYPTIHDYGLSPDGPLYPTIAHLLSPAKAKLIINKIFTPQVKAAKQAGLPFRITEMNSAARSGEPGVSDAFASALWVLDYSFRFLTIGVSGINIQNDLDNLHDIYSAIQRDKSGSYFPRPIYYGMLFFNEAAKGFLVPVEIKNEDSLANFSIYSSVQQDHTLRITVINKDPQKTLNVQIRISDKNYQSGKMIQLLAPSLDAKSGISLGGPPLILPGIGFQHRGDQLRPSPEFFL